MLGGFPKTLGYSTCIAKLSEGLIDKFCKNMSFKLNTYMYVRDIFEISINNYIPLLGASIDFIHDW